jgi:hypothetical protein
MTQPKFAPITAEHEVRDSQRLGVPLSWSSHRPGEARPSPREARLAGEAVRGPDQGYALELAERFADRLALEPGEQAEDVLAGAVVIALRRAEAFGRAPVTDDIEFALSVFKYLVGPDGTWPTSGLVQWRRERFAGAAHDYWVARTVADMIGEGTLRLGTHSIVKRLESEPSAWRELVGA